MQSLRHAIVAGGGNVDLVDGFTCKVDQRPVDKNGSMRRDVTFWDATRTHRFRSRSEVQRHFKLVDTHARDRNEAHAAVSAAAGLSNAMTIMGFDSWMRARKTRWRSGKLWRMKWDRRERGAEHELSGAEARGDFSRSAATAQPGASSALCYRSPFNLQYDPHENQGHKEAFHRKRKRSQLPSIYDYPGVYEDDDAFRNWVATRQSEWRKLWASRRQSVGGRVNADMQNSINTLQARMLRDHGQGRQMHVANGGDCTPYPWSSLADTHYEYATHLHTAAQAREMPANNAERSRLRPTHRMHAGNEREVTIERFSKSQEIWQQFYQQRPQGQNWPHHEQERGDDVNIQPRESSSPTRTAESACPACSGASKKRHTCSKRRIVEGDPEHTSNRTNQSTTPQPYLQSVSQNGPSGRTAMAVLRIPSSLRHGVWLNPSLYEKKNISQQPAADRPGTQHYAGSRLVPGSLDAAAALLSLEAASRAGQRMGDATEQSVFLKMEDTWKLVKHNKLTQSPAVFRSALSQQGLQELANLAMDTLALRWWRVLGLVLRTLALTACDDEVVARQVDSTGILETAVVGLIEVGEVRIRSSLGPFEEAPRCVFCKILT